MYLLGLTGGIAMGKTTVLEMFASGNVPAFDADAEVRVLLDHSRRLKKALRVDFPEAFEGGEINRTLLAKAVFQDEQNLRQLENLIHPLVMRRMRKFIDLQTRRKTPLAVLDIPLLFETGSENILSGVAVVSAPPEVQKKRALARPGMTERHLNLILRRQMPEAEKTARANFIISTGGQLKQTRKEVEALIQNLSGPPKKAG